MGLALTPNREGVTTNSNVTGWLFSVQSPRLARATDDTSESRHRGKQVIHRLSESGETAAVSTKTIAAFAPRYCGLKGVC